MALSLGVPIVPTHSRSFARTLAWRVPLGYFVLGATWIVASDWSLHADSGGLTAVAVIGMFKGLGFVLVSALLLAAIRASKRRKSLSCALYGEMTPIWCGATPH